MLTKDDFEQIAKLISSSEKRVKQQMKKMESVIVVHFDRRVGDHENLITHLEDEVFGTHKN